MNDLSLRLAELGRDTAVGSDPQDAASLLALLRLLYTVAVLLGVIVAVFFLMQVVPGDPVRIALGTRYTPESYEALRSASGLDQPLASQLVNYVGSAFTGDLGVSFRNSEPVTTMLFDRLPAIITLATAAIVVSYYWHFVDVVWIGLFAVIYFIR